jgi:hypothetical protein
MNQITITVAKPELLKVLKANRDQHRELYEEAWAGYCKAARAELEESLKRIKAGKPIPRYLVAVAPEDHTNDYEDVIAMLEMAINDEIELTQAQFKQYVQDDWGWKEQWVTSNTQYLQT